MRWLLAAVLAAAVLWSGYWFAGSRFVQREAEAWAAEQPGLSHQGISVAGFPNRFDLTVTEPRLANPMTGEEWSAPFLQLFALSYKPWHLIAVAPHEVTLSYPGGRFALQSSDLRGSLVLRPENALPLDRLSVVGAGLSYGHDAGPKTGIGTLRLATRLDPSRQNTHEIGLDLLQIAPDPAMLAALPADSGLPPQIDAFRLDTFASFSAPIDRFAGQTQPSLTALDIRNLTFQWGPILLTGSGTITPDDAGFAEGQIALRLDNWRQAIDGAVALGLIRREIAPTWAEFARRLSEVGDNPNRLELPMVLSGGRMRIGPIPLGEAPWIGP